MSMEFESDQKESQILIGQNIKPIDENNSQKIKKGFLRTIGEFFGLIKSYTVEDLARLKEAGVSLVESNVEDKKATAEEKIARAAALQAEAELNKSRAKNEEVLAQGDFLVKRAEAFERVVNAINTINRNGGNVAFDLDQIKKLLDGNKAEE